MPTKAEIDAAFLSRHDPLTQKFYAAKRQGQITPTLEALFQKAHGYLSLVHMRNRMVASDEPDRDYYVDEVRDDDGMLINPGTTLRSQELTEALAGPFKLSNAEKAQVRNRWGVALE